MVFSLIIVDVTPIPNNERNGRHEGAIQAIGAKVSSVLVGG